MAPGAPPKIRDKLIKLFPAIKPPAVSTIHAILDRHGLVISRKRRRHKVQGTTLCKARSPNQLRCADYKGEFRLGNRQYCYPLTITDFHSRYLLGCEAQEPTKPTGAFPVFERVFKEFGLPDAISSQVNQLKMHSSNRSMESFANTVLIYIGSPAWPMRDQPSTIGDYISTLLGRIDHWAKHRLRYSLNELPDMINFPHQAWLISRGTVTGATAE